MRHEHVDVVSLGSHNSCQVDYAKKDEAVEAIGGLRETVVVVDSGKCNHCAQ